MFKQINSRNGSYIWDNVFFQELEMIKEFSFPHCVWAKYSVWTLTGWYWMNSYENVLTSSANWITSQCIHILLHSVSVEVKFVLQLAWGENKSRCQEFRVGARRNKKHQHWQSPEESAPIFLVCLSNVLSQDQIPCHSMNAQSKTQQLCHGSSRKQWESRIRNQAVVISINASINKTAVYL